MEDSHRDLRITGKEWEAFIDDLNQCLDKFGVPAQERSELLAIVQSTRGAIVTDLPVLTTTEPGYPRYC